MQGYGMSPEEALANLKSLLLILREHEDDDVEPSPWLHPQQYRAYMDL
jgi:predicted RNase H-like HicB family nuclease